jgi:hypothetical protein
MKKVRWFRRITAATALSTLALVATGPGASAAMETYNAGASGTALSASVTLPGLSALNAVLGNAGIRNNTISERISFSNATADVTASRSTGQALGQAFFGSLDPLLLQVSRLVGYTKDKLPEAAARVDGTSSERNSLLAVDLPSAAAPLIHIGVAETEATAARVGKLVSTKSVARLAGIKVDLASVLSQGAIADLLRPLTDLLDGSSSNPNGGLIDQLNGLLGGVETTLHSAGVDVDLSVPEVRSLLSRPLVQVGIIESISETGYAGASRLARGITRLANIDLLGGFIHLDALNIESFASIDGTAAGAKASGVQRILGLKVGDNIVNLNAGSIQVLGRTIALPTDLTALLRTTVDALGLKVAVAPKPQIIRTATHARAATSSLHLELAPRLLGDTALFAVSLDGPASVADVRGGSVLGVREVRIPTTGVGDHAMIVAGFLMLGVAIGARKFVLSR